MSDIVLQPNSTAQWHALVQDAEAATGHRLDEELESYLVFLLMRFASRPEMAASVLALDYLRGSASVGGLRRDRLQEVGDKCLLYSGLFPLRARRRRVRVSYYVDLGRAAYHSLAEPHASTLAQLYGNLAEAFVTLMDVLQVMRRLNGTPSALDPLEAFALWNDTGSQEARAALGEVTDATPLPGDGSDERH